MNDFYKRLGGGRLRSGLRGQRQPTLLLGRVGVGRCLCKPFFPIETGAISDLSQLFQYFTRWVGRVFGGFSFSFVGFGKSKGTQPFLALGNSAYP